MERHEFERRALDELSAVYRLAYHLCRDVHEAEELVQEVYVRALKPSNVAGFSPSGGGMRSWLFAICHNVYFTGLERRRRRPVARESFEGDAAAEPPPRDIPTAWGRSTIDWEEVGDELKAAIHELRPEYREVLLMWSVEGLKYREIATIIGVPLGTVMSRLHRARAILAERLARAGSTGLKAPAAMGVALMLGASASQVFLWGPWGGQG